MGFKEKYGYSDEEMEAMTFSDCKSADELIDFWKEVIGDLPDELRREREEEE